MAKSDIGAGQTQLFLDRREQRQRANDRAYRAAEEAGEHEFECSCECVSVRQCESRFVANVFNYDLLHKDEPAYRVAIAEKSHLLIDLERIYEDRKTYLEVVAPNPLRAETFDVETLKHHVASLRAQVDAQVGNVTKATDRLQAALASAALVISLFLGFGPDDRGDLATILIAFSFFPFVVIAVNSLRGPQAVEEGWPGERRSAIELVHEWDKDVWRGLREEPINIESYERWQRMEQARRRRVPPHPSVYMDESDWLVNEIDDLQTRLGHATMRLKSARARVRRANTWLAILVVYLMAVTLAAQFVLPKPIQLVP